MVVWSYMEWIVLYDEVHSIKYGCGKSFAPFPLGCFFSGEVQSFENPRIKLIPLPHVDSEGHMCGANFKVDELSKKDCATPNG
ncbi:hypothetical protein SUGI_0429270 [Cryptomeria japonica]|nr:hypothetical protein SUGI_0429270 [Cryptomeria japonica]